MILLLWRLWDGSSTTVPPEPEPDTRTNLAFAGASRLATRAESQWAGRSDLNDILLVLSVMLPALEEDDDG